jgi:glycosyltransferase involved in cell wall biosynthesis
MLRNNRKIICFSVIPWNFLFQRPQQLMKEFAERGFEITFVELAPSSLFIKRKMIWKGIISVSLPFCVPRNINLPISIRFFLNKILVFPLMSILLKKEMKEAKIAWLYDAQFIRLFRKKDFPEVKIIFDLVDDNAAYSHLGKWARQSILSSENYAIRESQFVLTTSKKLYEIAKPLNKKVFLVPNGVDYDFFNENTTTLRNMEGIKRPIVGYAGAIFDWFDCELLFHVAKELKDISFVLIGPIRTKIETLSGLKNVHFLGEIKYAEIPKYLRNFDLGIIPFKINNLTIATNPIKLFEYFASGLQVIATQLPELRNCEWESVVHLANDANSFSKKIKEALLQKRTKSEKCKQLAKENSWHNRVDMIMRHVGIIS